MNVTEAAGAVLQQPNSLEPMCGANTGDRDHTSTLVGVTRVSALDNVLGAGFGDSSAARASLTREVNALEWILLDVLVVVADDVGPGHRFSGNC